MDSTSALSDTAPARDSWGYDRTLKMFDPMSRVVGRRTTGHSKQEVGRTLFVR